MAAHFSREFRKSCSIRMKFCFIFVLGPLCRSEGMFGRSSPSDRMHLPLQHTLTHIIHSCTEFCAIFNSSQPQLRPQNNSLLRECVHAFSAAADHMTVATSRYPKDK